VELRWHREFLLKTVEFLLEELSALFFRPFTYVNHSSSVTLEHLFGNLDLVLGCFLMERVFTLLDFGHLSFVIVHLQEDGILSGCQLATKHPSDKLFSICLLIFQGFLDSIESFVDHLVFIVDSAEWINWGLAL